MAGVGNILTGGIVQQYLPVVVAGGVDIDLSPAQAASGHFMLTGLLTANINVTVINGTNTSLPYPTTGQVHNVFNATSGAFYITFKTKTGTGIPVLQGRSETCVNDGTNIVRVKPATSDLNILTKSVAGAVDVTLTAAEAAYDDFVFTGAITANINVIFPVGTAKRMNVRNNATGAFTVTTKVSGGTGIVVAATKIAFLQADGTNVNRLVVDAT
jgi:hypothetical protein